MRTLMYPGSQKTLRRNKSFDGMIKFATMAHCNLYVLQALPNGTPAIHDDILAGHIGGSVRTEELDGCPIFASLSHSLERYERG